MNLKLNSFSNYIKSFVFSNIVSNGNFSSTTGWTGTDSTISASNNTLIVKGAGSAAAVVCSQSTNTALSSGRKFFISAKLKSTNSSTTALLIRANGTTTGSILTINSINSPVINTEYTLSGIFTVGTQTGNLLVQLRHSYVDAATSLNKEMEAREVFAIDLTALFGAGNEPILADCRNIFKFADGNSQPNFSTQLAT